MSTLRVGSLNLRAYPNPRDGQVERLADLLARESCDIVLLQECRHRWLDGVCQVIGMTGEHAHDLPPAVAPRSFSPDGCAIAFGPRVRLRRAWRIAPELFQPDSVQGAIYEEPPIDFQRMPERLTHRYSGRSILAELEVDGARFVAASFHATPGTGKIGDVEVGEWKPFFHGAVAIELAALELPFVFAMDANEPLSETVDSVRFHWDDARSGVKKLQALLGTTPLHRGRDFFRDWLGTTGAKPASSDVLFCPGIKVREALKLRVMSEGAELGLIFLVHGHQGTSDSERFAWFSKLVVRYIWRPLQRRFGFSATTPATDWNLRQRHEAAMFAWARAHPAKPLMIAGHTHRPIFGTSRPPKPDLRPLEEIERDLREAQKEPADRDRIAALHAELEWTKADARRAQPPIPIRPPCYFNTGCCCFPDGDVTGIEIADGRIRLVRWPTDDEKPAVKVLVEDALRDVLAAIRAAEQ